MNIPEINEKLYDCKQKRILLDRNMEKRSKYIQYFSQRKQIQLRSMKRFSISAVLLAITSLGFFAGVHLIATLLIGISFGMLCITGYKAHIITKFNKTIERIKHNYELCFKDDLEIANTEKELENQLLSLQNTKFENKEIKNNELTIDI